MANKKKKQSNTELYSLILLLSYFMVIISVLYILFGGE